MNDTVSAPITRTLDGKEYTFARLTPIDWSAFCQWINSTEGRRAQHVVPFDEMLGKAESMDGMLWLIHRAVKGHHEKVTRDQIGKLLHFRDMAPLCGEIMDLPEADASDPQTAEALRLTGQSSA